MLNSIWRQTRIASHSHHFRTLTCCYLDLFPNSRWQTNLQLVPCTAASMETLTSQLCIILHRTAKRPCNLNTAVDAGCTYTLGTGSHSPQLAARWKWKFQKVQSRNMNKEEQKRMWKKTTPQSIKIHLQWTESALLKTKLALPRISHVELKELSRKSSLKLNIKLKIYKRLLLKLLLDKDSWNSILKF